MIPMLLIAAGHYDGLSTGEFNQRIFRGIQTFQQSLGRAPSGILTTQEHSRLRQTGLEFLGLVGLKEVSHPTANAKLYVPLKLLDPPQRTARGVSFEGEMAAVDFSSFLPSEVSFPDLFLRLSTTSAQRQVT